MLIKSKFSTHIFHLYNMRVILGFIGHTYHIVRELIPGLLLCMTDHIQLSFFVENGLIGLLRMFIGEFI